MAQLVEAQLDRNDVDEVRASRKLVQTIEYEAREKLAATEGCEQLRMLLSRFERHMDDWDDE